MKVFVLANDIVKKRGVLAEHGLSLFIDYDCKKILFDTGQSAVFCHNAKVTGLDLSLADYIVLSHGHYDHCGGLPDFPFSGKSQKIYVRETAFARKFVRDYEIGEKSNGSLREIGIPWKAEDYQRFSKNITLLKNDIKIGEDIRLIGNVPSTVGFEILPEGFFVEKKDKIVEDMLADEQMLVIDTPKGLAVFAGCCHPGVINCLHHVLRSFPGKRIYALFAGMHLGKTDDICIQMTIKSIRDINIEKVFPLHCTGISAMCEFEKCLGDRCRILYSGDDVSL